MGQESPESPRLGAFAFRGEITMARRPDVLCAGNCGKKMWKGSGSLVPGKAMCREQLALVG